MSGAERRQYRRIKLVTKVTQLRGDFFHYYYSRDLSEGGMFLGTKEPFPKGTRVQLEFPLPGKAARLSLMGEVVRVVSASDGPEAETGMAIQFVDLNDDTRKLLAAYVASMPGR